MPHSSYGITSPSTLSFALIFSPFLQCQIKSLTLVSDLHAFLLYKYTDSVYPSIHATILIHSAILSIHLRSCLYPHHTLDVPSGDIQCSINPRPLFSARALPPVPAFSAGHYVSSPEINIVVLSATQGCRTLRPVARLVCDPAWLCRSSRPICLTLSISLFSISVYLSRGSHLVSAGIGEDSRLCIISSWIFNGSHQGWSIIPSRKMTCSFLSSSPTH